MADPDVPAVDGARGQTLLDAARLFANRLTGTTWQTIGHHVDPFVGVGVEQTGLAIVRQEPRQGITLTVEGEATLLLVAEYRCRWDHREHFLAVDASDFKVRAVSAPAEPLFRVDYLRQPAGKAPVAHVQIHASRAEWTDALLGCGDASKRGKRRARAVEAGAEPLLSAVHFPLGGHRFRPCLEDVLEMLLEEFGVDRQPTAQNALREARATYRRHQLAAAVRDSPETAADALEGLGYRIERPTPGPLPDHEDRLRQY